jgi:type III pantothenate kinase
LDADSAFGVSVVPQRNNEIQEKLGIPIRWLQRDRRLLDLVRYETPHTLGLDRIVAGIGASVHFPEEDVVVIDSGSAVTLDLILSGGVFAGGVIAPGLKAFEVGLNQLAPGLPMVSRVVPEDFPGTSTHSCLQLGVAGGFVHMLTGFIRQYETMGVQKFILTGGDAGWIHEHLKNHFPTVLIPELVFDGLEHWFSYFAESETEEFKRL